MGADDATVTESVTVSVHELSARPGCFVEPADEGSLAAATWQMTNTNVTETLAPIVALISAIRQSPEAGSWQSTPTIVADVTHVLRGDLVSGDDATGIIAVQTTRTIAGEDHTTEQTLMYASDATTYTFEASIVRWNDFAFVYDASTRGCDPQTATSFESGFDGTSDAKCWDTTGATRDCDGVSFWP